VILVGEMLDRETMERVLEAAETGHLVLSSLNTLDAAKTVEKIVGAFSPGEQASIRSRLAKALRMVVAQRLLPRRDGGGRIAVFEVLKMVPRMYQCVENADLVGQSMLQLMKESAGDGMQHFDGEIEKLVRAGLVDSETALGYATAPEEMQEALAR
jgi:twitching motility protein PilT